MNIRVLSAWILLGMGGGLPLARAAVAAPADPVIRDALDPIAPTEVGGILGTRLNLWRSQRLWRVVGDPFLLAGFKHPPGKHPWQGEHVGKWLHAASLAHATTVDARLGRALQETVAALVAAQAPNGYLGTYAPATRFFNQAEKGDRFTWDIWTHRYAIYGLLSYTAQHENPAALQACSSAADLLATALGPPAGDVTRFGTRNGLSSAVLLESIALLHRRTGRPEHLQFARHLVQSIERNPQLRLMAAMRAGEDVTGPGDGKAYQLMAALLGYLEMHRATGEKEFLDTVVTAWERIRRDHVNLAGGPWSYAHAPSVNHECFAPVEFFHPTVCVETCSTTTWIQLCLSLFQLTGEARYADAAERSLLNQLLGAQSPNGNDWAYHSMLNMPSRGYQEGITCCASSGPRALEVYARFLGCASRDSVVVASYVPAVIPLASFAQSGGRLVIQGGYPFVPDCTLRVELPAAQELALDFRLPAGAAALELKLNGVAQRLERTAQGLFRLRRTWQPGDAISLHFDFELRAHFLTATDGLRWVGFTWGPLALAQSLVAQTELPQIVIAVNAESEDGNRWLMRDSARPAARLSDSAVEEGVFGATPRPGVTAEFAAPAFRLRTNRRTAFVPYFLAGAEGGSVRTMFPTRRPAP
jgi:DUF1680 family protein